jgi:hypothetical protein
MNTLNPNSASTQVLEAETQKNISEPEKTNSQFAINLQRYYLPSLPLPRATQAWGRLFLTQVAAISFETPIMYGHTAWPDGKEITKLFHGKPKERWSSAQGKEFRVMCPNSFGEHNRKTESLLQCNFFHVQFVKQAFGKSLAEQLDDALTSCQHSGFLKPSYAHGDWNTTSILWSVKGVHKDNLQAWTKISNLLVTKLQGTVNSARPGFTLSTPGSIHQYYDQPAWLAEIDNAPVYTIEQFLELLPEEERPVLITPTTVKLATEISYQTKRAAKRTAQRNHKKIKIALNKEKPDIGELNKSFSFKQREDFSNIGKLRGYMDMPGIPGGPEVIPYYESGFGIRTRLEEWQNKPDKFVVINSGSTRSKRADAIQNIHYCWVDIDCYKRGLLSIPTLKEALCRIMHLGIRVPTHFLDSGTGFWLFWELTPTDCSSLTEWNRIQTDLCILFHDLGADGGSKDISRFCRMPGSINSKPAANGKMVTLWELIPGQQSSSTPVNLSEFTNLNEAIIKQFGQRKKKSREVRRLENMAMIPQKESLKQAQEFASMLFDRFLDEKIDRPHLVNFRNEILRLADANIAIRQTGRTEGYREIMIFLVSAVCIAQLQRLKPSVELVIGICSEFIDTFFEATPVEKEQFLALVPFAFQANPFGAMHGYGYNISIDRMMEFLGISEEIHQAIENHVFELGWIKRKTVIVQSQREVKERELVKLFELAKTEGVPTINKIKELTGKSKSTCYRYLEKVKEMLANPALVENLASVKLLTYIARVGSDTLLEIDSKIVFEEWKDQESELKMADKQDWKTKIERDQNLVAYLLEKIEKFGKTLSIRVLRRHLATIEKARIRIKVNPWRVIAGSKPAFALAVG